MMAIEVSGLSYRYGRVVALDDVSLRVPDGSVCALLGPNGAGKTTLLQVLMGLRRPASGQVRIFGKDRARLSLEDRAGMGYVAEGRGLPGWMRLGEVEEWLAPLYPSWDRDLASRLRDRFELDPARKVKSLSRGEGMKAALLCALAPRPRLLLLDEPFAGMDVMVRDELVRGLLETSAMEGWTVLVTSHEVAELEVLADRVEILHRGRILLSDSLEGLRARFLAVEAELPERLTLAADRIPSGWRGVTQSGRRLRFLYDRAEAGEGGAVNGQPLDVCSREIMGHLPEGSRVEAEGATLKEVFISVAEKHSDATGER
jgi:ABC-2 type transport system ATP-binding protein